MRICNNTFKKGLPDPTAVERKIQAIEERLKKLETNVKIMADTQALIIQAVSIHLDVALKGF